MSKVIDIYDDVFEEHNAIILDDNMKQLRWKYDYHSNPKEVNKHWHILCGHNKEECDTAGYDWVDEMFDLFKTKFGYLLTNLGVSRRFQPATYIVVHEEYESEVENIKIL